MSNVDFEVVHNVTALSALRCGWLDSTTRPGITARNSLLYTGDRLIIPHHSDLCETVFRLCHDALGHFGSEKSYAGIQHSFYWLNMRKKLESMYLPACEACQQNKSLTWKPTGPLHPLPVPDGRGVSVAIDFIGPLPEDEGFDSICTMSDHLGADFRCIPTCTDITADEFALLFFNNWYCKNGLPSHIISDRD